MFNMSKMKENIMKKINFKFRNWSYSCKKSNYVRNEARFKSTKMDFLKQKFICACSKKTIRLSSYFL